MGACTLSLSRDGIIAPLAVPGRGRGRGRHPRRGMQAVNATSYPRPFTIDTKPYASTMNKHVSNLRRSHTVRLKNPLILVIGWNDVPRWQWPCYPCLDTGQ